MSQELKTNWQPSASVAVLNFRARMLQSVRAFFALQHVLEVETPVLSSAAITDPNLSSFSTRFQNNQFYLHTSPEFFMKRLLAAGSGDIYQVCKVFRDDEQGSHHNPEFSMLEWYRLAMNHHDLMNEVEKFISFLCQQLNVEISTTEIKRLSYQQAFKNTLGIDPLTSSAKDLKALAIKKNIDIPVGMNENDRDEWLDWLMTQVVAPTFNQYGFVFVFDYPASQAALAMISQQDDRIAHRFELFYGELELANGFYELTDSEEQSNRFKYENDLRQQKGIEVMPLDTLFLNALESGLPESSGVAIGLDRLLMIFLGEKNISNVLSFDFDRI